LFYVYLSQVFKLVNLIGLEVAEDATNCYASIKKMYMEDSAIHL
jgi:hypothetical protein